MTSLRRVLALVVPLTLALAGTGAASAGAAPPPLSPRLFGPSVASAPQQGGQALIAAAAPVTTPLPAGGQVTSPNGRSVLAMQSDGNLVLYRDGRPVFNTGTFVPGSAMTTDELGNIQVTAPDGTWLWSTVLDGGVQVVVDDVGALKLLGDGGTTIWDSRDPVDATYNLEPVESLEPGQSMATIQGGRLVMQADGNLVSYAKNNSVIFSSDTFVPGSRFAAQDDDNAVIYGPDGRWLWQTGTGGNRGEAMIFLYEGELYVIDDNIEFLFYSGEDAGLRNPTPVASLAAGQSVTSLNGRYRLDMQTDGNLVLYNTATRRAMWSTRTNGNPGARFAVQTDGNLVVYRANNSVAWTSRTSGHSNTRLVLQDDGNLVLYSATNRALWFTRR